MAKVELGGYIRSLFVDRTGACLELKTLRRVFTDAVDATLKAGPGFDEAVAQANELTKDDIIDGFDMAPLAEKSDADGT